MNQTTQPRVAILYPGNFEMRQSATPENSRFVKVFQALGRAGMRAEPAVYHDDFCEEARRQLMQVDAVLVWVNPVEDGRNRSVLDAMLRDVAASGIFVSTHPDIILKLGTKAVLYDTRDIGWGCDTQLYRDWDQLRRELPARLATGKTRVLKQYRGSSGDGVWKVMLDDHAAAALPSTDTRVRARHAKRGCIEETLSLGDFFKRCEPYFEGEGRMIDQPYQERLPEGMIRCYLVQGTVAGFGHQAINALYPAPPGAPPDAAPQPGPRLYHPPTVPAFQALKRQLEQEWVPAARQRLGIEHDQLPALWDCDFLLGPKRESGEDTYVLCEINVSSVSPFPDSALDLLAQTTLARTRKAIQLRIANPPSHPCSP